MVVDVKPVTVRELVDTARKMNIGRILLTDYASVEPKQVGSAFVLVGMVTVVVTALDPRKKVIYRWAEQDESERMVTITAGTSRGQNPAGKLATRKKDVFEILREEGFEVDDGEWTPATASKFILARKKLVG